MSDETYYTVLDVSETATQLEIKTAYRNLLKKIHPDTVSTLSPELRRTAEDVTKEMIEAYSVLSDANKRREYDRQLAEYRQQSSPAALPRRPKTTSTSTPQPYASPPTRAPQPHVAPSRGWGAFAILVIFGAVVVARVFQPSDVSQQAGRIVSAYRARARDIGSYCKTHPTGFYGAPGTASGVSCSDWAHLTSAEHQLLQAACSNRYDEGTEEYGRCFYQELRIALHHRP